MERSLNNPAFTIGPISLQDFEIPTHIRYGGQQRVAIHRLLDGGRVVEPLGPDESEIQFEGVFTGQQAVGRARALDQLRSSGAVVILSWQAFRYPIILKDFRANYSNPWWISYCLDCVVAVQASGLPSPATAVRAAIASDISTAAAALLSLPIQLNMISTAAMASGALALGTVANAQAAAAAATTLSSVGIAIATASNALATAGQGEPEPGLFAASVKAQLANIGTLAMATTAQSYLGRIAMNIRNGDV